MRVVPKLGDRPEPIPYTGIWDQSLSVAYYKNGVLHKDDGPAIKWRAGDDEYFLFGIRAENKKEFEDPDWKQKAESSPQETIRML